MTLTEDDAAYFEMASKAYRSRDTAKARQARINMALDEVIAAYKRWLCTPNKGKTFVYHGK